MTKCEKYVEARLKGNGRREAGRIAGYESAPPSSAEKMYELVQAIRDVPESVTWVDEQIQQHEEKLKHLRRQKNAAEIAQELGVVTNA